MFSRLTITLSLLSSLILASAMYLGIGVQGEVVTGQTTPAFPEDEEVKSSDQTESQKSRLCDLYAPSMDLDSCLCLWHQLTIEATSLLETLPGTAEYPRGPPAV